MDSNADQVRREAYAALEKTEKSVKEQIARMEKQIATIDRLVEESGHGSQPMVALGRAILDLQEGQVLLFRRILLLERALLDAGVLPPRLDEE